MIMIEHKKTEQPKQKKKATKKVKTFLKEEDAKLCPLSAALNLVLSIICGSGAVQGLYNI